METGNIVIHAKSRIILRILEIETGNAICEYVDKPVGWIVMKPCVTLKSIVEILEGANLQSGERFQKNLKLWKPIY